MGGHLPSLPNFYRPMQGLALYDRLLAKAQQLGQERFAYQELNSATTKIYPAWLIEMYYKLVEPLLAVHRRLQGTWSHYVLKLDGGFKVGHSVTLRLQNAC